MKSLDRIRTNNANYWRQYWNEDKNQNLQIRSTRIPAEMRCFGSTSLLPQLDIDAQPEGQYRQR